VVLSRVIQAAANRRSLRDLSARPELTRTEKVAG
jgi:hypothetical protein